MIELKNVEKEYQFDGGILNALKKTNLKIGKGELISIVGPSGCGKSTLMHIMGLLDIPSSGEVIVEGKNIRGLNDNEISDLRNRYIGFIFQQFNLITKMTVLENVTLPSRYYHAKDFDPDKKALELLDRFSIREKFNSYPNKLSGGQQQRVSIARALINNPKLILADEPTGNLDTKSGDVILKLLKELNEKDGITVVVVTHDMNIAKKCKRMIKMVDGEIISTKK